MRAQEQRKFAKRVDDDEETMSVEDAVPCDQRSEGVVDSGGTGKKRARLKIPNGRKTSVLVVYLFHYKDRSILFPDLCSKIVIFGREFSLSTLTFHFFIYSFIIRFFIYTLLLWFTWGTVGRRLRYIVNDQGLRCFSVSRTRRT